jgi:hypothetical protein
MKNIARALFYMLIVTSCSNNKLPDKFIGKYVDSDNPSNIIEILNSEGEFKEISNGCVITGKFIIENLKDRFKISGFTLTSENKCPDGIHLVGVIDYESEMSYFIEGTWGEPYMKLKNTQAIHFGGGIYGGIGPLYFKETSENLEVTNKNMADIVDSLELPNSEIVDSVAIINNIESQSENLNETSELVEYIKYNDNLIYDKSNNCNWHIAPDYNFNYFEALKYIDSLNKHDSKNWSLPNFKEIKKLYKENLKAGKGFNQNGKYYPARINSIFDAIGSGSWFWISDKNYNNSLAYTINLNQGIKVEFEKINPKFPVHLLLYSEH